MRSNGGRRARGVPSHGTRARPTRAHGCGLGVNAGHDLDLDNLPLFRKLPHLAEVSIGHALISRALFVGLDRAVREYVAAARRAAIRPGDPHRLAPAGGLGGMLAVARPREGCAHCELPRG